MVWYDMVWYGMRWNGMVCYGMVWYELEWYGIGMWFPYHGMMELVWRSYHSGMGYLQGLLIPRIGPPHRYPKMGDWSGLCLFIGAGHCSWAQRSLVFVGIRCCLWAAIFVCGQSSSLFGWLWWRGIHGLSLASGVVSWLPLVVLLGCARGWLKKEVMSQVVTLVWCLNSHVRLHIQSHVISLQFTVKTSQSWSSPGPTSAEVKFSPQGWSQSWWAQARPTCQLLPLKTTRAWQSSADLGRNYRGTMKTSNCLTWQRQGLGDPSHYPGTTDPGKRSDWPSWHWVQQTEK